MPTYREFFLEFLAWLTLAVPCAAIGIPLWLRQRRRGNRLLAQENRNPVTWTGWEILTVFFLTYFFWPGLVGFCLDQGFLSRLYGAAASSTQALDDIAKDQRGLWIQLGVFPFNLATLRILFQIASGTKPYQLRVSFHLPLKSVALACLSFLIVTPLVFGVHFLASLAYVNLTGREPKHPLEQLAEGSPLLVDAVLIGLIALVAAPIWEELFFRGVIQPYLAQQEWRSHFAMGLASLIGLSTAIANLHESQGLDFGMILGHLSPVLFIMILVSGYLYTDRLLKKWIPDRNVFRGIFATSLLFAMVHSSVWPTPVPLFFLALGLGFLAYRTQSVLAPIILHSLFNAVSCIALLFLQFGPEPKNGSEATSAGTRPDSTATSTRVPAVWQLR